MEKRPRIAVLGDILYDCFVWADRLPRTGESVIGYENGFFSGGKGANQAVQAAKLGAEVFMIGKVGNDSNGEFLIAKLKDEGVNTDFISVDDKVATGTCCVFVDKDGNNAIIIAPMANNHVGKVELEKARTIIESADALLAQLQILPETVRIGFEIARDAGCITVLDPAPPRQIDNTLFALADYVTPNETEAEFFTGIYREGMVLETWCEKTGEVFAGRGVKKLILTLGSRGTYYHGKKILRQNCLPAKTIDTTGAGDAFTAAFAVALVKGKTIKEAIRYGNGAGALTTTRKGSQPAMPDKEELDAYLKQLEENQKEFCGE